MDMQVKRAADEPIVESDDFIAEALLSGNLPTLMMVLVHLTGDTAILDSGIKPGNVSMINLGGGLSEADGQTIRAQVLDALRAYRDGRALPPRPDDATLRRMMEVITGTKVPDEYVPMMLEEMALDGIDHRAFHWSGDKAPAAAAAFNTVVIGAGMSGLLAAVRLAEAGLPYTIIEKNDDVGGTWYENSYPGCRVDSSNHWYSYSFEPNHDWPEHFSQRGELHAYFRRCAEKYDIRRQIRFKTEVVEAVFDEARSIWAVRLRDAAGREEVVEANALISAVGQLNRARIPDFKGRERFRGPAFHSAEWEDGHELAGKRIAVVGAGASAFQLIPELAQIAGHLTCFQRSPSWMLPNPEYHDAVAPGKKWLMKHVPFYAGWYRFLLFWVAADGVLDVVRIDPEWPDQDRSINALNEMTRQYFTAAMLAQLEGRDDLIEKVIPKYPPFGKRMLQDNGHYLRALTRPNVTVVDDDIAEIVEDGIIDATGTHHKLDAIVYATGFHANKFLWPMRIVGRGGKVLSEVWGDTPRAYLGITVPDFPNLFCLYGPSTNLAHGGSIIFHSECQVRYVMECLKLLIENDKAAMEVTHDAHDDYVARLERELLGMVWSHKAVNSWYKNERGIVVNTSPWRLIDYWNWTRAPAPADYRIA